MIYTLTFSPSIDYYLNVLDFKDGAINKSESEKIVIGGKGINVSLVLKELGLESYIIGFKSGFTGNFFQEELDKHNIKNTLIPASGYTRINVKINSTKETAINTNSLYITNDGLCSLYNILEKLAKEDILIISGNVNNVNIEEVYKHISSAANVVLDIDYNILPLLKYKPLLIKPNRNELERLFSIKITKAEDVVKCSQTLKDKGAKNVIVSLDKDGAILFDEYGNFYYNKGKKINVVSSVGAGDSLVAGFIYGYVNKFKMEESFELGIICATASCLTNGIPNKKLIDKVKENKNEYMA